MSKLFLLTTTIFLSLQLNAQTDSLFERHLETTTVKSYHQAQIVKQLPDVHQTYLISGKKNEVIEIASLPANLAEKTGRQIFARIPSAFVYDMDGSGNQVNIATRGLDPHRSWEYNIRQNGVIINSDMYGYPASHYSPPMEAIQRIEMIRGSASLQYGAEFGGMINYTTKSADTTQRIGFESMNSVGSYGLFSAYNAVGGKINKLTYYAYYQKRVSDGYRNNATSDAQAQFLSLQYDFQRNIHLKLEVGRSTYLYRIPGPLTDSMFHANPRQSTRTRNYFNPDIYVPSLTLHWKIAPNTTFNWITSGILGSRNSVEFEGFADKIDEIDPKTLQYKPRAVNIDRFNSKTSEIRLLHHYQVLGFKNVVTSGIRYFNNDLHRTQQGKGSTGSNFDLTITGNWGRNLHFISKSIAVSVENMVYLTDKWTASAGFRYEKGKTDMTGYIAYLKDEDVPNRIVHDIPTFGINSQYKFANDTRMYAGFSQAHRPVLFKDIIPTSSLERANKNLKNAFGYNFEIGINGKTQDWLKYDLTLFQLQYNNRLGNIVATENNANYIYKTNIGNSQTQGIETYIEITPLRSNQHFVSFFTATSLMKGVYQAANIAVGTENKNISGNEIESVPRWISRNGLNLAHKSLTINVLYSHTSQTYSDPINTQIPTKNGAKGIVPVYNILDMNALYRINSRFTLRANINNLTNTQYFTKRPLFYPGPGIWSSDGRSFVFSLGVKM